MEQMDRREGAFKGVRCVFAPNMSVGMNLMFRVKMCLHPGPEYDIVILEAHHHLVPQ
jgi:4-hydroxy-tetrahydrodipicolinate reductase